MQSQAHPELVLSSPTCEDAPDVQASLAAATRHPVRAGTETHPAPVAANMVAGPIRGQYSGHIDQSEVSIQVMLTNQRSVSDHIDQSEMSIGSPVPAHCGEHCARASEIQHLPSL